jgi:hypothetical protein
MLGFGGAGGLINMSYQLNESIHNTQWVTGHFHLIFAGAIVLMYFMVAYDLWPQLTGCAPLSPRLVKLQIWFWFVGMMVLSMPWHLVGLLGMPRRMAYYGYTHPALLRTSPCWRCIRHAKPADKAGGEAYDRLFVFAPTQCTRRAFRREREREICDPPTSAIRTTSTKLSIASGHVPPTPQSPSTSA